jgi:hypothetical protein
MKHLFSISLVLLAVMFPATAMAVDNEPANNDNNVTLNETIKSNYDDVVFGELDPTRGELEIHYYGMGPATMTVFVNGEEAYLSSSVLSLPGHGTYDIGVLIEPYGYPTGRSRYVVSRRVDFKYETPAPEIRCFLTATEVLVDITWPESDGYPVYTGCYSYLRLDQDQYFDVEAFMTDNGRNYESEHAYETIWVPELDYDRLGDMDGDGTNTIADVVVLIDKLLGRK